MATNPKSYITADTDVNLDFLTKEEKEALLSKKMDMIRQRNKALTERHKLIEADKKKAEEAGQAVKPSVDSQTLPAEGVPKSRGRGRGQPHNKDANRLAKERPKSSGDFRDSSNYEPIVDTTDLANYRSKGLGGLPHERETYNNTPKNKRKPAPKEEATPFPSNFEYEPIIDMKDLDKRFGALLNTLEVGSLPLTDHANHAGQRRLIWRHDNLGEVTNDSGRIYKGRLKDFEGPPPDPSFNPLADRRRSDKKEESADHRRHPRNYGGSTDLSRVKQSMKNMREKEKEKPQGSKPLEIVMTGKERRNHEEWKAERDRYDKERIQRQMSDAGNWKRAWDAEKSSQENDDQNVSYSSKVEPAKRPAGRIGSGRFDRGERDERPRSAVIGKGALQFIENSQPPQRQHNHEQQQMQPQQQNPHLHSQAGENKPSRGRGRGRGRGRSRGSVSGEKFPRPRTWSGGDDRFVECQKELLLVKFDNTAGDNSVEVEYDDDEFLSSPVSSPKAPQPSGTTPGRGPTGRTPNQVPKQQSRGGKQHQQQNKSPRHKDKPLDGAQQSPPDDKWTAPATSPINLDQVLGSYNDESRVRTSSHSQSYGDSEEWEDCTESSGMHEEDDDFGLSCGGLSCMSKELSAHDMLLECRLNPEAPEFLPSSPDLVTQPCVHAKGLPWTTNGGLSCPLLPNSGTCQQAQSIVPKDSQLSPRSSADPHASKKAKLALDDSCDLIPEIPKSINRPDKLNDVTAFCLPTNLTDTKETKRPSDALDNISAALHVVDNVSTASDAVDNVSTASDAKDNVSTASAAKDNVSTASAAKDNVSTASDAVDNVSTASVAKDNVSTASVAKDNVSTASVAKDNVSTASVAKDNVSTASVAKDNVSTASVAKDNVSTASVAKDNVSTASVAKDNVSTASVAKDNVSTASVAKDNVSTASVAKDNVSTASDAKDNVSAASVAKDNVSTASDAKDNVSAASDAKDNVSTASDAKDNVSTASDAQDNVSTASDAKDNVSAVLHAVDNLSAASDASTRLKEVTANSSTAAPAKTPVVHISPSLAKGSELISPQEETKGTSKESVTILSPENTHDALVAKDIVKDVSKLPDPAEDSSTRTVGLCANKSINGDVSAPAKTTVVHISPSLAKGSELISPQEETKGTSKESVTILSPENTHDALVAKDIVKDVSKLPDPAEDSSTRSDGLCANKSINGGVPDEPKLNGESTVSDDHTPVMPSEQEDTTKTPKDGNGIKENHNVPTESLSTKGGNGIKENHNVPTESLSTKDENGIKENLNVPTESLSTKDGNGIKENHNVPTESLSTKDGNSAHAPTPAGSQNSSIENKSALPTADVSASS